MTILINEKIKIPSLKQIDFTNTTMKLFLSDSRILIVSLAWYPKLISATKKQLHNYVISPDGYGIHWPELNEDLSVYGFLFPNK